MRGNPALIIAALLTAATVPAIAIAPAASSTVEPATVTAVEGGNPRIVVEPHAAERIGLKTAVVRATLVTRKRTVAARILDREHRLEVKNGAGAAVGDPLSNLLKVLPIWDAASISPELPARILPVTSREPFEPQPAKYLLAPGDAEQGVERHGELRNMTG